jgi:iron complex outermembrane receptor protein
MPPWPPVYLRRKYLDGYSDIAGSGDIVGGSGTAGKVDGAQDHRVVYAELNLPVIKNLELNAAVRADRYTGASGSSRDGAFSSPNLSSTSPKIGLRWTRMKELLVRGSYGKGFRAPALDNLYAALLTNTAATSTIRTTTRRWAARVNTNYCDTQLTVQNNSNRNLKPESPRRPRSVSCSSR